VDFDQLGEVGGELGIIDCHSASIMIFTAAYSFFVSFNVFSFSCIVSFKKPTNSFRAAAIFFVSSVFFYGTIPRLSLLTSSICACHAP
jgi:uncharacterized membrane protein YgdD (TMEM256/DUF423 family)